MSVWLNTTTEQERIWQKQRLAALASTKAAVERVLAIPGLAERKAYVAMYREKWGNVCADALESMVRKAWENRMRSDG